MSRRLDDDGEEIIPTRRTPEREMTLGTGAILGIFFGLVLLLGAFFGFGYKLGSSSSKSGVPSADTSPVAAATSANFSAFKPSAGSPPTANAGTAPGIVVHDGTPTVVPPPGGSEASRPTQAPPTTAVAEPEPTPPAAVTPIHSVPPAPVSASAPVTPTPTSAPGGSYIVQVAAVSHQEDADLLVNALHARGYAVAAHSEPGDKLIHIQIGPFSSKKDADAMKVRLTADGYNAYVK